MTIPVPRTHCGDGDAVAVSLDRPPGTLVGHSSAAPCKAPHSIRHQAAATHMTCSLRDPLKGAQATGNGDHAVQLIQGCQGAAETGFPTLLSNHHHLGFFQSAADLDDAADAHTLRPEA